MMWMVAALLLAAEPELVLGLRLDPFQSMQWTRDELCVVSPDGGSTLPARGIRELWPGPARGAFAVALERGGVGLLLDQQIVPVAHPFGENAWLRSAEPGALLAWLPDTREFWELRAGGRTRRLFSLEVPLRDFDLTRAGHVVYLTATGETWLRSSATEPALRLDTPVARQAWQRVFVNAAGTEVVWMEPGVLVRQNLVDGGSSERVEFTARDRALVRTSESRTVRLEPVCALLSRP